MNKVFEEAITDQLVFMHGRVVSLHGFLIIGLVELEATVFIVIIV